MCDGRQTQMNPQVPNGRGQKEEAREAERAEEAGEEGEYANAVEDEGSRSGIVKTGVSLSLRPMQAKGITWRGTRKTLDFRRAKNQAKKITQIGMATRAGTRQKQCKYN